MQDWLALAYSSVHNVGLLLPYEQPRASSAGWSAAGAVHVNDDSGAYR